VHLAAGLGGVVYPPGPRTASRSPDLKPI